MNSIILNFVTNPDCAIVLLLAGILLLYGEFNRPGTVLLGCVGALAILYGWYGLSHLPIRLAAVMEAVAGLLSLAASLRFPRRLLDGIGFVALAFGIRELVVTPPISRLVAVAVALIFSSVSLWLGRVALQARRNKALRPIRHPHPSNPSVASAE
jgi:membrane-bound serine protease (ClpP class)